MIALNNVAKSAIYWKRCLRGQVLNERRVGRDGVPATAASRDRHACDALSYRITTLHTSSISLAAVNRSEPRMPVSLAQ